MSDELVVCVEDTYPGQVVPLLIHKGMVYTVVGRCNKHRHLPRLKDRDYVRLAEVGGSTLDACGCYWAGFFRPIRRPDISALQELARQTTLRRVEAKI